MAPHGDERSRSRSSGKRLASVVAVALTHPRKGDVAVERLYAESI
jgi:hypothetical protein